MKQVLEDNTIVVDVVRLIYNETWPGRLKLLAIDCVHIYVQIRKKLIKNISALNDFIGTSWAHNTGDRLSRTLLTYHLK